MYAPYASHYLRFSFLRVGTTDSATIGGDARGKADNARHERRRQQRHAGAQWCFYAGDAQQCRGCGENDRTPQTTGISSGVIPSTSERLQIEIFTNRIRSNQARGRPIINDSSIQTLFVTLTTLHTQLLQKLHDLENQRGE